MVRPVVSSRKTALAIISQHYGCLDMIVIAFGVDYLVIQTILSGRKSTQPLGICFTLDDFFTILLVASALIWEDLRCREFLLLFIVTDFLATPSAWELDVNERGDIHGSTALFTKKKSADKHCKEFVPSRMMMCDV